MLILIVNAKIVHFTGYDDCSCLFFHSNASFLIVEQIPLYHHNIPQYHRDIYSLILFLSAHIFRRQPDVYGGNLLLPGGVQYHRDCFLQKYGHDGFVRHRLYANIVCLKFQIRPCTHSLFFQILQPLHRHPSSYKQPAKCQ